MLFFDGGVGLVLLALWLFCLFDVITADSALCRNLPKPVWILVVLLLPDIGSILWLVAGRTWAAHTYGRPGGLPYKGNTGMAPVPSARRSRPTVASNPDDDEDFQAQLRARAEEQRRRYREQNPD